MPAGSQTVVFASRVCGSRFVVTGAAISVPNRYSFLQSNAPGVVG